MATAKTMETGSELTVTAVYRKNGRWFVAWVEEVPGVLTQGRTIEEARENLTEALTLIVESNREPASSADRLSQQDRGPGDVRESLTIRA